jgi:hypothetical protein
MFFFERNLYLTTLHILRMLIVSMLIVVVVILLMAKL